MTLLHYAAMRGNHKMIEFLLDHGANVNGKAKDDMTPLHWACGNFGSEAAIVTLLDRGANPAAQNSRKETPSDILRQLRSQRTAVLQKMADILQRK